MNRIQRPTKSRKASFESLEGRKLLSANSFKLSPSDSVVEVRSSDDTGRLTKVVSGFVYGGNPDLD